MIKRKLLGHESLENRQLLAACSPITQGTETATGVTPTFLCDGTIVVTAAALPTIIVNNATLTSGTYNNTAAFSGTLGLTVTPDTDSGSGSMTCIGTFGFNTGLPTATGYGVGFSFASPYNATISGANLYTSPIPSVTGASGNITGIASTADTLSAQWNVCSQFFMPYDDANSGSSSSTVLLATTTGFALTTAGTGAGAGTSLGNVAITNLNGLGGEYIGNAAVNYKMFNLEAVSGQNQTFAQALLNPPTLVI